MNTTRDILNHKLNYNVAGIITEYLKELPFLRELENETTSIKSYLGEYYYYNNYVRYLFSGFNINGIRNNIKHKDKYWSVIMR